LQKLAQARGHLVLKVWSLTAISLASSTLYLLGGEKAKSFVMGNILSNESETGYKESKSLSDWNRLEAITCHQKQKFMWQELQ
jgi:hypothetical protein